jgi:hypothetical protein
MSDLRKINRDEWQDFLDINPSGETPSWKIIGVGITDKSTDYNAEKTEEKWIIERTKRTAIDSYGPSSGVEQTAYKGDEVFEFIDNIRYRMLTGTEAQTHLLEVDKYSVTNEESTPTYRARMWDVAIEISSNGGETAKIKYNIDYSGDPTFGTVTFNKGVPTFSPEN